MRVERSAALHNKIPHDDFGLQGGVGCNILCLVSLVQFPAGHRALGTWHSRDRSLTRYRAAAKRDQGGEELDPLKDVGLYRYDVKYPW